MAKSSDVLSEKLRDPRTGKFLGRAAVGKLFERDASMVTAGVATMGAGIAGLRGAFAASDLAGTFEQGLAGISAVAKASVEEMDMARLATIKAGMDTQFSPTEALAGMQQLVTAGQTIQESAQTLIPVLDLAAGSLGNLSVDNAADAVVGTLNSYGMAAEKATMVTNQLLRITQLTNFATNDFQGALAKAASNGAMFGTSLDDVLITVGLLRNANIDASSAGTGFRESIRRVATMSAQQDKVIAAGVAVYDEKTGKMRSIVDITLDLIDATKDWSEAKRSEMLGLVYGSRGLLAYNAIQRAQFKTMKDGALVTYEGRDAIQRLRAEMAISSGDIEQVKKATAGFADQQEYLTRALTESGKTAQEFREKLLDTYAGQKTLLKGVMETIIIQVGEPLNRAFKPVVRWLAATFSKLAAMIESLSPSTKEFIARVFVLTSVLMAAAGAVVAARFGFVAFSATMGLAGVSVRGVVSAFLRLSMISRIVALGAYLVYQAYRRNLGGIADRIHRLATALRLVFEGLKQAFTAGGFSGALRHELNKAENSGIKAFIIRVYAIAARLRAFFEGIAEGFASAWKEVGPVVWETFSVLKDAVYSFLGALGVLQVDGSGAVGVSIATWRRWGALVGKSLAIVLLLIAKTIKFVAGFAARHPTLVKTLVLGVAAWKLLGFAMWNGLHAFHAVRRGLVLLQFAFGKIVVALKALRLLVISNPFLAIAAAVAVVAFLIYDNWEWIKANVWDPFIDIVTSVARAIWRTLRGAWRGAVLAFWGSWKVLKRLVWDPFMWALDKLVSGIKWVLTPAWNALVLTFRATWGPLKKYVFDPMADAIGWIADKLQWIWDHLPGLPEWLVGDNSVMTSIVTEAERRQAEVGNVAVRPADNSTITGMFAKDFGWGGSATAPMVAQARAQGASAQWQQELTAKFAQAAQAQGMSREEFARALKAQSDKPVVVQIDGATVATAVSAHSAKNNEMSFGQEEGFWDG